MEFLTSREIAERYGVSLITAQKWIKNKKFPNAQRFGRDWAVPKSDLLKFKKPKMGRPRRQNP